MNWQPDDAWVNQDNNQSSTVSLDGLVTKAKAELTGLSEIEIIDMLGNLDNVVGECASINGYIRASHRINIHGVMNVWLPQNASSPTRAPLDTVDLVLHCLSQQQILPLQHFLNDLSENQHFAKAKLFSLLVLREAASGNMDGVVRADHELNMYYGYIRKLAEQGNQVIIGRRKGGKKGGQYRTPEILGRHKTIKIRASQLLKDGHSLRELPRLIAEEVGCSSRTVRNDLKILGFHK